MMKDRSLLMKIGFGLLGIVFVFFMASRVVPKIFVSWTKAAPALKVSLQNSYLIGADILARADGKDECEVNVFVLDKNNKGVEGTRVTLAGMSTGEMEGVSDLNGKTSFKLKSETEGQYVLSASIGGSPLEKNIKVTFRN